MITHITNNRLSFWCPGCEEAHTVPVNGTVSATGASWQWNNDREKPTLSPSLMIRTGHYVPGVSTGFCWCKYNAEHPDEKTPFKCSVCHSIVCDGMIHFLGDCTHRFAGQTVALPVWPAPEPPVSSGKTPVKPQ